jgi:glycosyltransferase involved in cell wall biosynthesis
MVTTFYPPHNFGGDGIFVRRLAREMSQRGHSVEVVYNVDAYRALGGDSAEEPPVMDEGVRVHGLHFGVGVLSALLNQQTGGPALLRRRLDRIVSRSFDVIHFHNVSLIGGPGVLGLGHAVKLYSTHEWWLVCPTHVLFRYRKTACLKPTCLRCCVVHLRPPQIWRYTRAMERALGHVDAFIAPSRFCESMHRQRGLDLPFVRIPHFVPDLAETAGTGVPSAGEAPTPYFLYVGRLERLKGPQTLISAIRQVPGAELWIVGTGSLEGELRAAAEGAPVRLLGWKEGEDLRQLYGGAVALLVPSLCFDMFPLVTLESLQQGTPLIVRELGALPEIVADSGAGIVYSSEAELAAAMNELLTDIGKRDELGRRGSAMLSDQWSVERHLSRYEALIHTLLDGVSLEPLRG